MQALANSNGTFVVDGTLYPSINALERAFGFRKNALRGRLNAGWSLSEALTKPIDLRRSNMTRDAMKEARAKNGARRRSPNTAKARKIEELPICDLIRAHLADKTPRPIMEQRIWWATLGHYYSARSR